MDPVIQVLASAEMATGPLLTPREPSWGGRSRQNPPTVCPCVFGCEDHRRSLRKYGCPWAPPDLLSSFNNREEQEKGETEVSTFS
ncbi:hypothetical protein VZT92_024330 [Zoarces viviparus]|uniref:Uncharacterized protein n=1 Tax=Zoarces viviparus TaxID=48416 RepID=A0AAW1E1N3_ZOAVI